MLQQDGPSQGTWKVMMLINVLMILYKLYCTAECSKQTKE